MFIMFIMFNMPVHAYVHGAPPHTPTPTPDPIHPPATPQWPIPRISKNSITVALIKIIQFCLKGGLMGGVRSNH